MANMKPDHPWHGDDEGHNCTDCPSDSIWKCDRLAHIDVEGMVRDVQAELAPELERAARQRRLAGLTTDGRPIGPCPHQPFDWFAEMSDEAWAAYEEAERKGW